MSALSFKAFEKQTNVRTNKKNSGGVLCFLSNKPSLIDLNGK